MGHFTAMPKPNHLSPGQMRKVGVTILGTDLIRLRCDQCQQVWTVKRKGLKLPKGYWICPKGCNKPEPA